MLARCHGKRSTTSSTRPVRKPSLHLVRGGLPLVYLSISTRHQDSVSCLADVADVGGTYRCHSLVYFHARSLLRKTTRLLGPLQVSDPDHRVVAHELARSFHDLHRSSGPGGSLYSNGHLKKVLRTENSSGLTAWKKLLSTQARKSTKQTRTRPTHILPSRWEVHAAVNMRFFVQYASVHDAVETRRKIARREQRVLRLRISLALFLASFSAFQGRTSPVSSSSQKGEGTRPGFSPEPIRNHPDDPESFSRARSRDEKQASLSVLPPALCPQKRVRARSS